MLSCVRNPEFLLQSLIVCAVSGITETLRVRAAEQIQIVDRWPEIFQLMDTSSSAAPEKAVRLVDYLRHACPEIADRLHIGDMTRDDSERYLAELQRRSFAIRSLARQFTAIHATVEERFAQAFPDFRPSRTTVYLTVSRVASIAKSRTIIWTVWCFPLTELRNSPEKIHPFQSFSATSYSISTTFKLAHLRPIRIKSLYFD